MAYVVQDRVLESTTTTGTGALTLAAAITGFRRFSAVCALADTVPYFIEAIDALGQPTGDYEYGVGTYSSANTLTRTTVLGSSNGGGAVNFAAGSKNVGMSVLAADFNAKAPLASPTFTGSPAAPTQAAADNTTKLATTGWVYAAIATIATAAGFAVSLAANGYIKFPSWLGGLILQWGSATTAAGGTAAVSWPIPFPTGTFQVATSLDTGGTAPIGFVGCDNPSAAAALFRVATSSGTAAGAGVNFRYIVVGR